MKNKETKLIKETYDILQESFNNISWNNYGNEYLNLCLAESKDHDRFRGGLENARGINLITEARYFAIKRLVECLDGYVPNLKNYISTQKSCFYAYALVNDERFHDTWSMLNTKHTKLIESMRLIAEWDYCDLIKTEDRRKFANSEFHQDNLKGKSC